MRVFALLLPVVALATLACPAKNPEDDFGPGKAAKNYGTTGNKAPTPMPIDKPDFEHAVDVVPTFDKAASKLTVTLKIKPGYHAYAPGEEIGKPVELAVDAPWTAENVTIPAGTKKDIGEEKSVILEGDVPLTAIVKGGTGDVSGKVTTQICTDKACDRPRPHAFKVPAA